MGNRPEDMEAFTQLTIFLIVIILLVRLAELFSSRFGLPAITKLVGSWVATWRTVDSLRERILILLGNLHQGEMGILN